MKKELFEEYAELQKQADAIADKQKLLKEKLVEDMNANEIEKVESDFGSFYFTSRKTWKYSDSVKAKESEVKDLKKKEEEDGTAEFTESKSLSFRAAKGE